MPVNINELQDEATVSIPRFLDAVKDNVLYRSDELAAAVNVLMPTIQRMKRRLSAYNVIASAPDHAGIRRMQALWGNKKTVAKAKAVSKAKNLNANQT